MTTALFRPKIDHFSSEVSWVSYNGSNPERKCHVDGLYVVVGKIIVYPHEEILVLVEGVERAECCPEEELVHSQWETSAEQIGWAFFEWNTEQGLSW